MKACPRTYLLYTYRCLSPPTGIHETTAPTPHPHPQLHTPPQKYPPELTVAGPNLRYDYEPSLVHDLLERLVPSNMLLVVSARDFKGKTDKVRCTGRGKEWSGQENRKDRP